MIDCRGLSRKCTRVAVMAFNTHRDCPNQHAYRCEACAETIRRSSSIGSPLKYWEELPRKEFLEHETAHEVFEPAPEATGFREV